MYYLHPPQTWDYAAVSALGLARGLEGVLTARTTSKPAWLRPDQLDLFKLLRDKIRAVTDVTREIESFKQTEDHDDNTFFRLLQTSRRCGQADKRAAAGCLQGIAGCLPE